MSLASLTVAATSSRTNLCEFVDAHRLRLRRRAWPSLLNGRHVQGLLGLVVQLVDDGDAASSPGPRARPRTNRSRRDSRLRSTVGTFGSAGARFGVLTASATTLSSLMFRQRRRDRQIIEVDAARHHLGECLDRAAERDVLDVDVGGEPQALGRHVRGGADARGGEIQRAGLRLGRGDEIGDGLVAFRRCRDQHARLDSEQDHRREIPQRIVRQRSCAARPASSARRSSAGPCSRPGRPWRRRRRRSCRRRPAGSR